MGHLAFYWNKGIWRVSVGYHTDLLEICRVLSRSVENMKGICRVSSRSFGYLKGIM
jgi:hypothetical protein